MPLASFYVVIYYRYSLSSFDFSLLFLKYRGATFPNGIPLVIRVTDRSRCVPGFGGDKFMKMRKAHSRALYLVFRISLLMIRRANE